MTDDDLDRLHRELDRLRAELDAAKQFARSCAKDTEKALKRQTRAKLHADLLQAELDTLREGIRELGGDPTQVQNLWVQIRLRNRQWRDEQQRAERVEAALDRVRATVDDLCDEPHPGHDHVCPDDVRRYVLAALDEPTDTTP
jgi:chromosome segregation ATPase